MKQNWLDHQHRGFEAYLEATDGQDSCDQFNRSVLCAKAGGEQFDALRLDCLVQTDWIEQIEIALPFIENAIRQARQFLLRQGETVPIEKAKRVSRASVEHLGRHSELITTAPDPGQDLRPDKLYITENIGTYTVYENRFLYMLLRYVADFVGVRYQKISELAGASACSLRLDRQINHSGRKISFSLQFSETSQGTDGLTQSQATSALERIQQILQSIELLLRTELMKEVAGAPLLKPPIARTNIMLHDQNFKAAFALYTFLVDYDRDGYEKLELFRYSGNPDQDANRDLARLVSITSYLTNCCSGLRPQLAERYETWQRAQEEEARLLQEQRLAALRQQLGTLSPEAAEYIHAMEQRLTGLEEAERALALAQEDVVKAASELDTARSKTDDLEASVDRLSSQLRAAQEESKIQANQLRDLKEDTEIIKKKHQQDMDRQRQEFEKTLQEQKEDFLRQYEELAQLYRLAKARSRSLSDNEDCGSKEAFVELEKEFEAFQRYYKQQWRLAKKHIRKDTLWKKESVSKEEQP